MPDQARQAGQTDAQHTVPEAVAHLHVRPIDASMARATFALAALNEPGLTLPRWRARLKQPLPPPARLMGVFDARNCALCVLRQTPEGVQVLAFPPDLSVDIVDIVALLGPLEG
jgi:hypothetical protein